MKVYKTIGKNKILMMWLLTGLGLAVLLIFPTQCRAGAASGVFLCIQVLIPSLFPFMVLSSFVASSGLASRVPAFTERITRALFSLPKESFAVILLALSGGYPVGAQGIQNLLKKGIITEEQAKRMSLFCVASGPGFLVTYIGCAMMRNPQAGYILLASQTMSFLILGMVTKLFAKEETVCTKTNNTVKEPINKNALVTAVKEAIGSCGYMCALVVLFASLCEIYIYIIKGDPNLIWITGLIEITNGAKYICGEVSLSLISALCGFGGLCVHMQIFGILDKIKIRKSLYFLFRILSGILNGAFTYILLRAFPQAESVFSTVDNTTPSMNKGITGCVFLIICCVTFLFSVKGTGKYSSSN